MLAAKRTPVIEQAGIRTLDQRPDPVLGRRRLRDGQGARARQLLRRDRLPLRHRRRRRRGQDDGRVDPRGPAVARPVAARRAPVLVPSHHAAVHVPARGRAVRPSLQARRAGLRARTAARHPSQPAARRRCARAARCSVRAAAGSGRTGSRPTASSRSIAPSFGRAELVRRTSATSTAPCASASALIDQTSFAKFEITGPGALGAVQWLSVANMDKSIGHGHVHPAVQRARRHRVRPHDDAHRAPTRGTWSRARRSAPTTWAGSAPTRPTDGSGRSIRDLTSARAVINLCGPLARDVLQAVCEDDVSNAAFRYARARRDHDRLGAGAGDAHRLRGRARVGAAHPHRVRRATCTSCCAPAGEPHGIVDVGYRAIDTLRMEKGYLYWSTDITPDTTPWEAGLDWRVDLDKGDFCGRDALVAQREAGVSRRLCTFTLESMAYPVSGEAIIADGDGRRVHDQRQLRPHGRQADRLRLPARSNWPTRTRLRRSRCTASRSPPRATTGALYDPDNDQAASDDPSDGATRRRPRAHTSPRVPVLAAASVASALTPRRADQPQLPRRARRPTATWCGSRATGRGVHRPRRGGRRRAVARPTPG